MALLDDTLSFISATWPGLRIEQSRIDEWEAEIASGSGRTEQQLREDIFEFVVGRDRVDAWARMQFSTRGLDVGTSSEDADTRIGRIVDELMGGERTFNDLSLTLNEYGEYGSIQTQTPTASPPPASPVSPIPIATPPVNLNVPTPSTTSFPSPPTQEIDEAAIALEFGWLPSEALDVYLDTFVDTGDVNRAWAAVRQDKRYEQWFPGNLTEDGRPRYAENVYAAVTASYDDVFRAVGIDGKALNQMRKKYGDLIAGDVSPEELETDRVVPMYERIVSASDFIKERYASEYGVALTDRELLTAAMNPDTGSLILEKQISLAEIGGEAAESGFGTIDTEMVNRLFESGKIDRAAADRLFQQAENILPTLNVLAARHADPDDDFNIEEFVAADVFQDPKQRRRMNRLIAQEKSLFTGVREQLVRSRTTGGVSGLEEL